jgi:hypothetical protein
MRWRPPGGPTAADRDRHPIVATHHRTAGTDSRNTVKKHSPAKKGDAAKKGRSAKSRRAVAPEVIPGAVVRDLVDSNEQRIAELQRELELAVDEADEAERGVAGMTAPGPSSANGSEAGPKDPGDHGRPGPPRTTVVTRARTQAG